MKLEDQVVSLELAKRLKELGVKQNTFWHYAPDDNGEFNDLYMSGQTSFDISAFTVAELGEMLAPKMTHHVTTGTGRQEMWSMQFHIGERCEVCFVDIIGHRVKAEFFAPTEADARAKMLIHLIEKGLVKP